jgi:hypothetical protein
MYFTVNNLFIELQVDYSTEIFQSNYMKLALSGADTDVSMAESIGSSAETQSTVEDA